MRSDLPSEMVGSSGAPEGVNGVKRAGKCSTIKIIKKKEKKKKC